MLPPSRPPSSFTRRSFLAAQSAAPFALPQPVRILHIGWEGHPNEVLGPIERIPNLTLVAAASDNESELARILRGKKTNTAPRYRDWRAMLDKEKADVVGICNSGGRERVEAILECTRRGIPWIAEKPLANTRADLARIRAALKAKPVPFSTLLPMRHDPPYLALKRIVDSGQIGEVAQISAQKSYKAGERPAWMKNPETYGGTLPWIGIHMVDLMRFTSGREMREVFTYQGQVGNFPGIGKMENTTGTVFQLDNGGVATLHMDYYRPSTAKTHGDDRLRLAGAKGVAEYMGSTGVTVLAEGQPPETTRELPPAGSIFLEFLDRLYNGRPGSLSEAEIFRLCEIVLAARESAELRRPVKL